MGQKVHPIGFRLGINRDWDARWFARGTQYGKSLLEDLEVRNYLYQVLDNAEIARIEIEKTENTVRIILHSGQPGRVIGKRGQEIETLRNELTKRLKKNIEISVQEVKKPELDATLIANNIAVQLEKRGSYKQAMRRAVVSALKGGAKGVKVCCGGRLNGAEIARQEWTRVGSIPLHTLRADVDYGFAEANTTYGKIGVKVWVYRGEFNISSRQS